MPPKKQAKKAKQAEDQQLKAEDSTSKLDL